MISAGTANATSCFGVNYAIMPPKVRRPNRLLRSLQRHNSQHNNGDSRRQVWPSQAPAVCFPRMSHRTIRAG